ncbi:glycerophosphodiester phosphodiesterase [Ureibacillus sinduriensis]|uniref:Glycerophosphodiester phosphodiesterase n=1 Tax=Ureibacillus sinduriensis BLB-1 = JCM 15800 TaxID=1384057 RepID=A0A0A3HTV0_9BACL|nr:glycerophosphodiester phosphodiesterase family protein [Ureibacillus sinduriensis]KGR74655.1 glycerophosphodiester phosphodiesterase [Ureibacillus sinduriensis BLB-1 = JCM 15800]
MSNRIPIFAHRGASGHALENTFRAFKKARILGADGIELDVQCTKDNQLVVFHDLDLFRLTGVRKKINDCTLDEVKKYPLGKHFLRRFSKERIPALQEVVEWSNHYNMPLNIELKESLLHNHKAIISCLQKLELPMGSHFSSFHDELMRLVKMQRVDFQTALIVTKKFNWQELSKQTHIDALHAHKRYYQPEYFKASIDAGKGLRYYAITGKEPYLANPDPSVIGWITDFPDSVAKAAKKKKI